MPVVTYACACVRAQIHDFTKGVCLAAHTHAAHTSRRAFVFVSETASEKTNASQLWLHRTMWLCLYAIGIELHAKSMQACMRTHARSDMNIHACTHPPLRPCVQEPHNQSHMHIRLRSGIVCMQPSHSLPLGFPSTPGTPREQHWGDEWLRVLPDEHRHQHCGVSRHCFCPRHCACCGVLAHTATAAGAQGACVGRPCARGHVCV